jgi:NitT/TauT family transport system substrate-binding protein
MNKVIAIILIIGIGIGVFTLTNISENETPEIYEEPIRLSINPFPGTDYAFVAQEMGFFDKYGVNVELVLNPNYSQTVELFTSKKVDGAFEVYADAVLQKQLGMDVTVVYVTDQSTDGDVIVGTIDDFSKIKGKTIGVVGLNSFSHIFVSSILDTYGIDYLDVFYENVDETNILKYLDDGKIVAGHTWEPTKTLVENNGYHTIATAGDVPGIITDVLVFNSYFIDTNSNDVQAVVNALNDARNFVYSNPEKSISIMAEIEGLSFDDMSDAINDADRPDSDSQKMLFSNEFENSLYELGSVYVDFYKNTGLLSSQDVFDSTLIDDHFVNNLD